VVGVEENWTDMGIRSVIIVCNNLRRGNVESGLDLGHIILGCRVRGS